MAAVTECMDLYTERGKHNARDHVDQIQFGYAEQVRHEAIMKSENVRLKTKVDDLKRRLESVNQKWHTASNNQSAEFLSLRHDYEQELDRIKKTTRAEIVKETAHLHEDLERCKKECRLAIEARNQISRELRSKQLEVQELNNHIVVLRNSSGGETSVNAERYRNETMVLRREMEIIKARNISLEKEHELIYAGELRRKEAVSIMREGHEVEINKWKEAYEKVLAQRQHKSNESIIGAHTAASYEISLRKSMDEIKELSLSKNMLEQALSDARAKSVSMTEAEAQKRESSFKAAEAAVKAANVACQHYKRTATELENSNKSLTTIINTAEEDVQCLNKRISNLENRNKILSQTVSTYERNLADAEIRNVDLSTCLKSMQENLNKKISDLENRNETLSQAVSTCEKNLVEAEIRNNDLSKSLKSMHENWSYSLHDHDDKGKDREIMRLRGETTEQALAMAKLRKNIKELSSKQEDSSKQQTWERARTTLKQKIKQLTDNTQVLEEQLVSSRAEADNFREKNKILITKLERMNEELIRRHSIDANGMDIRHSSETDVPLLQSRNRPFAVQTSPNLESNGKTVRSKSLAIESKASSTTTVPVSLQVIRRRVTGVTIEWVPVELTAPQRLLGYRVYVNGALRVRVHDVYCTSACIDGLQPDRCYSATVRSVFQQFLNGPEQESMDSASVNVETLNEKAMDVAVPTNVHVSARTVNKMAVSWRSVKPSVDSMWAITGYRVYLDGNEFYYVPSPHASSAIVRGLESDRSYSVSVRTQCRSSHEEAESNSSSPVIIEPLEIGTPDAPGLFEQEQLLDAIPGTALLQWRPVQLDNTGCNNGSVITGYTIYLDGTPCARVDGASSTSVRLEGLHPGTADKMAVIRTCGLYNGGPVESDATSLASVRVVAASELRSDGKVAPLPPSDLREEVHTDQCLIISWVPPPINKLSVAVDFFRIYAKGPNEATVEVDGNVCSATINGLLPASMYLVTLTSHTQAGVSSEPSVPLCIETDTVADITWEPLMVGNLFGSSICDDTQNYDQYNSVVGKRSQPGLDDTQTSVDMDKEESRLKREATLDQLCSQAEEDRARQVATHKALLEERYLEEKEAKKLAAEITRKREEAVEEAERMRLRKIRNAKEKEMIARLTRSSNARDLKRREEKERQERESLEQEKKELRKLKSNAEWLQKVKRNQMNGDSKKSYERETISRSAKLVPTSSPSPEPSRQLNVKPCQTPPSAIDQRISRRRSSIEASIKANSKLKLPMNITKPSTIKKCMNSDPLNLKRSNGNIRSEFPNNEDIDANDDLMLRVHQEASAVAAKLSGDSNEDCEWLVKVKEHPNEIFSKNDETGLLLSTIQYDGAFGKNNAIDARRIDQISNDSNILLEVCPEKCIESGFAEVRENGKDDDIAELAAVAQENEATMLAARVAKEKEATELAAKVAEEKAAAELAAVAQENEATMLAAKVAKEKAAAELAAKVAEEKEAAELASQIAKEKEATELAAKVAEEKAAAELASQIAKEKEATELAAKVAEQKAAAELASQIAKEKEATELAAKVAEEKAAAELASQIAKEKEATELAAKVAEEKAAAELASQIAKEKEVAELAAKVAEEKAAAELASQIAKEKESTELTVAAKVAEEKAAAELASQIAKEKEATELAAKVAEEKAAAELASQIAKEKEVAELAAKVAEEKAAAELASQIAKEKEATELAARVAKEKKIAKLAAKVAEEKKAAEVTEDIECLSPGELREKRKRLAIEKKRAELIEKRRREKEKKKHQAPAKIEKEESEDTRIENTVTNMESGLELERLSEDTKTENTATNKESGLELESLSEDTKTENTATNKESGLELESLSEDTKTENNATNKESGLELERLSKPLETNSNNAVYDGEPVFTVVENDKKDTRDIGDDGKGVILDSQCAVIEPIIDVMKSDVCRNIRSRYAVAIYDYDPITESPNDNPNEELSFTAGSVLELLGDVLEDGFINANLNGKIGLVPSNYIEEKEGSMSGTDTPITATSSDHNIIVTKSNDDVIKNASSRRVVTALYDYDPESMSPNDHPELEIGFQGGDEIVLIGDLLDNGFYMGELNDRRGLVPSNFIENRIEDVTMLKNSVSQRSEDSKTMSRGASSVASSCIVSESPNAPTIFVSFPSTPHLFNTDDELHRSNVSVISQPDEPYEPDPSLYAPSTAPSRIAIALNSYNPAMDSPNENSDLELYFDKGEIITLFGVIDDDGFIDGQSCGLRGLVPSNFVQVVSSMAEAVRLQRDITNESSNFDDVDISYTSNNANATEHDEDERFLRALYDYRPLEQSPNDNPEEELEFDEGDMITVYGKMDDAGFYIGSLNGRTGLVPSSFLSASFLSAATDAISMDGSQDSLDMLYGVSFHDNVPPLHARNQDQKNRMLFSGDGIDTVVSTGNVEYSKVPSTVSLSESTESLSEHNSIGAYADSITANDTVNDSVANEHARFNSNHDSSDHLQSNDSLIKKKSGLRLKSFFKRGKK